MPLARTPGVGPDDWQPERSPLAEVNPVSGEIVFFEALAGAEATGAATPQLLNQTFSSPPRLTVRV